MARTPPLVEVQGARQLRATLKAAGDDLSDLKDANAAVGSMVASAAAGLVPVVTGALAGTIRGTRAAGGASVKAGAASVPYAGPIHWGWPARNIKAQPFLTEAGRNTEPQWTQTYLDELEKIIARVEGDN